MPKMHEDNDLDAQLARIFPEPSSRRYGRFFDVNQRSVQRWYEIPHWKPTDKQQALIEKTVEALDKSELVYRLDRTMQEAIFQGVPEEIIAAHLAHWHKRITGGREIE